MRVPQATGPPCRQSLVHSTSGQPRLAALDGLRALAFGSVFVHHAFHVPLLWCGVDLFFVLSGFLITGILIRQKMRQAPVSSYLARRALRIVPPYALVVSVCLLFLVPLDRGGWWWYALFVSNVRDAFSSAGSPPALSPMWSLAVEVQFYLVWPVAVFALGRRGFLRLCVGLIVLAPVMRAAMTLAFDSFRVVYHLLPTRFDLLAGGALIAVLWHESEDRIRSLARAAPVGIGVCATLFLACVLLVPGFATSANSMVFNVAGYSLIAAAMVCVVTYCLPPRPSPILASLCWEPLVFLGTISYMMYLSHKIVLIEVAGFGLGGVGRAGVSLLVVTLIAAGSWFCLERPLLMFKQRAFPYVRNARRLPIAPSEPVAVAGDSSPSREVTTASTGTSGSEH